MYEESEAFLQKALSSPAADALPVTFEILRGQVLLPNKFDFNRV